MGKQTRPDHETEGYVKSLHRIGQITMLRGVKPWLMYDFIFNLSPLGRENQQCVETLHKFTNQVIKDRRQALKLSSSQQSSSDDGTDLNRSNSNNNNDDDKGVESPPSNSLQCFFFFFFFFCPGNI